MLATGLLGICLFASWPLLTFANHNRTQIDVDGALFLIRFLALTVFVTGTVWATACWLGRGRRTKAFSMTAIVGLVLFFNYHLLITGISAGLATVGQERGENPTYLVLVCLVCAGVLIVANQRVVLQVTVAFGLIANLIPGLPLALFALSGDSAESPSTPDIVLRLETKPSIFHIVTDTYPRQDAALRMLAFDNSRFVESLRNAGFYVAQQARSNYPQTVLSLSSTLAMRYLVTDSTQRFSSDIGFRDTIQGRNPVVSQLRASGYRYAHQGAVSWDGSSCTTAADQCLSTGRAFEHAVLELTPLRRLVKTDRSSTPADLTNKLSDLIGKGPPIFVFAHSMPPHPPATFDSQCRQIWMRRAPRMGDWDDRAAYTNDMKCMNAQLLALVGGIIARDPDAVIIMHGDHGTAFSVDWSLPIDAWTVEQIEERFSILLAIRLPERCRPQLYPTLSLVNIYPLVFACLSGHEPVLRTDRSYVSAKDRHPQYGTAHLVSRTSPGHSRPDVNHRGKRRD